LSLNFPSIADEEGRIRIEKNVWSRIGDPIDLECPPSGRKLRVSYKNGDEISLEFKNLDSGDGFQALYGTKLLWQDLPIPVALLEINLKIAGRNLCLSPHGTNLQAGSLKGVWMRNSAGGLAIS
jgi:hypothetical protein